VLVRQTLDTNMGIDCSFVYFLEIMCFSNIITFIIGGTMSQHVMICKRALTTIAVSAKRRSKSGLILLQRTKRQNNIINPLLNPNINLIVSSQIN
jgi:hypothetical protein